MMKMKTNWTKTAQKYIPGWPDEFGKKIAQNEAQSIICNKIAQNKA
jgi:hypothetical protein